VTITSSPEQLGVIFKSLRQKSNLTLRHISEQTGISQSFIWKVEHGRLPSMETAVKLATFYGFELELWLIRPGYSETG
jgi:transcriptional regulator with XRE-family HTH domain